MCDADADDGVRWAGLGWESLMRKWAAGLGVAFFHLPGGGGKGVGWRGVDTKSLLARDA